MTLTADARIETQHANRYLDELCYQLDARARAKPDLGVRVDRTETDAKVDFGWARCTIRVGHNTLELHAEATDPEGLRQVRELISRHLDKLASDNELPHAWWQDGAPVADSHIERRDAMRGFHQRMRDQH